MARTAEAPERFDAHVWTYFSHHPLDPDESVFVLAEQGSLESHDELMALFLHYLERGCILPPGLRKYGQHVLEAYENRLRAEHETWLAKQALRKANSGRPSKKAHAANYADQMEKLRRALATERVIAPSIHRDALNLVPDLPSMFNWNRNQKNRGSRGRPTRNAQRYDWAMQVLNILRATQDLSEAQAIRLVAEGLADGTSDNSLSRDQVDRVLKEAENLRKQVEEAFYRLKPYLKGDLEPWMGGLVPLELMLDK